MIQGVPAAVSARPPAILSCKGFFFCLTLQIFLMLQIFLILQIFFILQIFLIMHIFFLLQIFLILQILFILQIFLILQIFFILQICLSRPPERAWRDWAVLNAAVVLFLFYEIVIITTYCIVISLFLANANITFIITIVVTITIPGVCSG